MQNPTLKLSPLSDVKEYTLVHDWSEGGEDMFVQGGDTGLVIGEESIHVTAFIETFPKKLPCFIRGEGKTITEAEENAWEKYQKILVCNHEMERRGRTDGYGYCKHCSYAAMVFEPLTSCCKCGKKTDYAKDFRNKWYCEKHSINKPKNPNPKGLEGLMIRGSRRYLPRKLKKAYKQMFVSQMHHDKNIVDSKPILKKKTYKLVFGKFTMNPIGISTLKRSISKTRFIVDWSRRQLRRKTS